MIKYLDKLDPKVCTSCKLDLFKVALVPNGLVCGKCGQQYQIRIKENSKC